MSAVCSPDVEDRIVKMREDLHEFMYVFGDGNTAVPKLKKLRDELDDLINGLETGRIRN